MSNKLKLSPLRIWLVRHGESQGNVDMDVHRTHADHAIPLSEEGHRQAQRAGERLKAHLETVIADTPEESPYVRLWTSPYRRTRETAKGLLEGIGGLVTDHREDIRLCEQQFGLFDGMSDDQRASKYKDEHEHYQKQEEFEGRFWARMPLGESRFDVANRIHAFLGTLVRDNEKHGISKSIVVCHGVTLRAFVMQRMHLSPEWFEQESNPKNCAVRFLNGPVDEGYIFEGF
ncbi:MAG: histidine phosphatase family protein [Chloroflexi bacterium]|nr:histidine phosphatase family protein [Chloroflexota bacterium]